MSSSKTQFPITVEIIPGELTSRIHLHEIRPSGKPIPCWSYVSDGLRAHLHNEVVFTLRRQRNKADEDFPEDPLLMFSALYRCSAQQSRVIAGAHAKFEPDGLFGHHVLFDEAYPFEDVPLPPACVTALLINDDELRAVQTFGCARVLARMAIATRFYPFPPWSESNRRGLLLASTFEQSLLSKIAIRISGRLIVTRSDNLVTIGVHRELHRGLQHSPLPDLPIGFLALRDPDAGACLVWEPGQSEPTAFSPLDLENELKGVRISCAYAVVLGEQQSDEVRLVEDGFVIMLTDASWAAFRCALREGTDLMIPATAGRKDFALTWRDNLYGDAV